MYVIIHIFNEQQLSSAESTCSANLQVKLRAEYHKLRYFIMRGVIFAKRLVFYVDNQIINYKSTKI